ncbi:LysR family transcriptional regulator [Clostridium sp. MCC353]|uniref:LysR family transcriptional regulator n=1 Tax=Clostridium sp. MCC353 TaxID=2592646 RepID=UPI001C032FA3|nr:LysR family transcriptional regulator [Clostridium sp. MCC353]MBT9775241.1 LysR family transcriptional regulator [Clostridium sp. MCC353]
MTIRHVHIFLSVCECGYNLTKAAEKLYMAQPAVTLAIKEIEKYYGVSLFDRIGKRLYITEAGIQFREYAVRISTLFDDMEKGLKNWDSFGIMRIGASITIGSQFMANYVEAFSKMHPNLDIRVLIDTSDVLEQKLLNNELDFALNESSVHQENLMAEPYMEDSLAVICPARQPYYPGQIMTKEEFKKHRFLLREHGSGTREVFEQVMAANNIVINPVWEAMSTTALVNAVIHGLGIAVVPRRMVSGPLKKGLIYIAEVEGIEFKRWFYIVYHRDKLLSKSVRSFMDLCKCYELDYPIPKYNGLF